MIYKCDASFQREKKKSLFSARPRLSVFLSLDNFFFLVVENKGWTENCCRLIDKFIAVTLYGGLDDFPSTKLMVYVMSDQFLEHDGSESTITIEAFKSMFMNNDTTYCSNSPFHDLN